MNAREKLDEIKAEWGLKTDVELAKKLEVNKLTLDSWVKRDKIPDKIILKLGQNALQKDSAPQEPTPTLSADESKFLKAWQSLPENKKEMHFYRVIADALEHEVMSNPIRKKRRKGDS